MIAFETKLNGTLYERMQWSEVGSDCGLTER